MPNFYLAPYQMNIWEILGIFLDCGYLEKHCHEDLLWFISLLQHKA